MKPKLRRSWRFLNCVLRSNFKERLPRGPPISHALLTTLSSKDCKLSPGSRNNNEANNHKITIFSPKVRTTYGS